MKRFAIISCVKFNTVSAVYKNSATAGVELVANKIYRNIKTKFGSNNIEFIRPNASKDKILSKLTWVSERLDTNGMLLFYFHGHGASIKGEQVNDEVKDQALVCADNYLVDDTIDIYLRRFKPTQKILSIVDSCSSETVVEWSQFKWKSYPQIIHIASSRDEEIAHAYSDGGIMSKELAKLLYGYQYHNWTYEILIRRLKLKVSTGIFLSKTKNVNDQFLREKLFN